MTTHDSGAFSDRVMLAMREVAEAIILPRFNQLAKHDIRSKTHPGDLVTIADEESERALERMLGDLLPGALMVGEEAAAADPGVLGRLITDDPVWIIDPIDGTSNFVNGKSAFAVMIALMRGGETVMGWIHDPLQNRTLRAEHGAGTWVTSVTANAETLTERLIISPPISNGVAAMTAGIYNKDMAAIKGKFARVVRLGCAAYDYWSLADGRMHVLCYRRLKPWDHAPGVLIHGEAGGYNRLLSGDAYRPSRPKQTGLLCAPSKEIWDQVVTLAGQ